MTTSPADPPRRGSILLVEDREDVREGLAQLLEFHGFLVEEAGDGEAALARLRRCDGLALVVLDLMLPGIGGPEIRGQMLADPDCADLPTIIVTASDVDAPGRAGLCPAAFLEKPFRFEQLLDLVRRFVVPEETGFLPAGEPASSTVGR